MKRKLALEALGLKQSASQREIRVAFRHLAKRTHPDLHRGDVQAAAKFAQILEAYAALTRRADPQPILQLSAKAGSGLPFTALGEFAETHAPTGPDLMQITDADDGTAARHITVEILRAFLAEHDIGIRFDGRYFVSSALQMAATSDQIEAYLKTEVVDAQVILDDLLLESKAKGTKLRKSDAERALRKLTREARKKRKVVIAKPLLAPVLAHEQEQASSQWVRLAEIAFESDTALTIAVLQHFIWQVKRKLRGMPLKHHLMPVVWSSLQGSGKTTFVTRLLAPLEELAAGPVLLSDVADRRSVEIYRYPVLFIDDMEAIPPSLVPVLKSLVTSGGLQRRRLGTSMSVAIPQLATLIGTANTSIEALVADDTGHRRFVMLPFRNGEVAKGGDPQVWDVVDSTNYALLWRSVDASASAPIMPQLEVLFRHQAQSRGPDHLKEWLIGLDLASESVKSITVRDGVQAQALYNLFILETGSTMTLSRFGSAMSGYARDPEVPFGAKIKKLHGIFYTLK